MLATNIDVLLTDELFSASVAGIGEGAVWRADRYDVDFLFRHWLTSVPLSISPGITRSATNVAMVSTIRKRAECCRYTSR